MLAIRCTFPWFGEGLTDYRSRNVNTMHFLLWGNCDARTSISAHIFNGIGDGSELSPPTNSPCQPLTVFIPRTLDVQAAVSSSCSFRSYDDDYDDEDDDDNDAEDAVAAKAVKEKEKTAFRPSRLIIWSKDRTTATTTR
ncbi:hypothetical protein HZH68_005284 [Vespula germanica]|uniref:Uncharacterized protein n=1 Tax=Vespula germanica TaxID=30212 RepID=A0A834NDC4_VESGE|nr:hypothetical protein HZH68_005284 [Vespula germanica]